MLSGACVIGARPKTVDRLNTDRCDEVDGHLSRPLLLRMGKKRAPNTLARSSYLGRDFHSGKSIPRLLFLLFSYTQTRVRVKHTHTHTEADNLDASIFHKKIQQSCKSIDRGLPIFQQRIKRKGKKGKATNSKIPRYDCVLYSQTQPCRFRDQQKRTRKLFPSEILFSHRKIYRVQCIYDSTNRNRILADQIYNGICWINSKPSFLNYKCDRNRRRTVMLRRIK